MSIQNELDQIKNAVYGKDVRGSIHDGLKKGYEKAETAETYSKDVKDTYDDILLEWESNPNKDPELITARGNKEQLAQRLNDTDQQLAHEQQQRESDIETLNNSKFDDAMLENGFIKIYANGQLVAEIDGTAFANAGEIRHYIDSLVGDGTIQGVSLAEGSLTTVYFEQETKTKLDMLLNAIKVEGQPVEGN